MPPVVNRRQEHLGVTRGPERRPGVLEVRPQMPVVVDLAVVGDHPVRPGGIVHRLTATLREIDDRKPAMTQRDPDRRVDPVTGRIRTPVFN